MEVVRGCVECLRLAEAYEAETMMWFRLEGQLRIAEYGRDEESAGKIAKDLDATTRRRTELRTGMDAHQKDSHTNGKTGSPFVMGA